MEYIAALKVAAPIATWAIQTLIVRRLERRAKLVGFITAAPSIHVRSVQEPFWLHALVLIIRNEGRKDARSQREYESDMTSSRPM
jgi:hypothetical protein